MRPSPHLSNKQARRIIDAARRLPQAARLHFEKGVLLRLRGAPSDSAVDDAIAAELRWRDQVPGFLSEVPNR